MQKNKLLNFDDLLLYAIKITDDEGGQVLEPILKKYITKLESIGIKDAQTRVEQMLDEPHNSPMYEEAFSIEQNKLLVEVKNFIFFSSVISARNVCEEQLDLLRALSKKVVKMIDKDHDLKQSVNSIAYRVTADDHSKLYNEMFDLREKIKQKYNSSNELRTTFLNLELDNLEIIKNHKGQWQKNFIECIFLNADFIKRDGLSQEISHKINHLMNSLQRPKIHDRCFLKFIMKLCLFKTQGCRRRAKENSEYYKLRTIIGNRKRNYSQIT